jgi:hypothetical protein
MGSIIFLIKSVAKKKHFRRFIEAERRDKGGFITKEQVLRKRLREKKEGCVYFSLLPAHRELASAQ